MVDGHHRQAVLEAQVSDGNYQNEIARAVASGWVVTSQTESSATLVRRKNFSWGWFILWFVLFFIVGGIIYWIYWTTRGEESMLIQVDADGGVNVTTS